MKHTVLLIATLLLLGIQSYAQTGVAINTNGNEPDNSAMLDVSSTTKGVLVPRMTASQRQDIVSPAKGLLVFQEDGISGFYYHDGSDWTRLSSGTYTETDPVFGLSAAKGITEANLSNWNTAFGWGNHSGLYRPIAYVPAWGEITSNPFSFSSVADNQLLKYNFTSGKWENWTPNYSIITHTHADATAGQSGFLSSSDKTKLDKYPVGTAAGQMQYWNGTAWIVVSAGQEGQFLRFSNSAPTWVTLTEVDLLNVGDPYQGGIIAYFLQPGDPGYDENVRHGLIAAPFDQSTDAQWGCFGTLIGGTGTVIGTGAANTAAIVVGCSTAGIAARICDDLELNGYNDWYLPSKDELNKLSLSKDLIGGFEIYYYWSSSETSSDYAYVTYFSSGGPHYQFPKNSTLYIRVRAVRTF